MMWVYYFFDAVKLVFLLLIPPILILVYGGIAALVLWFILRGFS